MSDAQGTLRFMDRRQQVVVFAIDAGGRQVGDALGVAIGSFGHHRQFGGHGREFFGGHGVTLGDVLAMASGASLGMVGGHNHLISRSAHR